MSKLIKRRDFLLSAAPLVAAPLILGNRNVIAAPSEKATVTNPPLEVLYDTLGSAATGWGWASESPYTTIYLDGVGTNYFVTTCYIGSVSLPKTLRHIELALYGGNTQTQQNYDMTYFIGHMFFAVWNGNINTFYQQPLSSSVARVLLPVPSLGSTTNPYINSYGDPVYVIGWENLNISLPANVPLEMSFQFEGIALGDLGSIYGSNITGAGMRFASSVSGNGVWDRPMACRLMVSDANPTAANCEISGRVLNQSGRGIVRARLTVQNARTGETVSTLSNPFGYFRFAGLPAADFYILSVSAKGHTFIPDTQSFQLNESVSDVLFVGR